MGLNAERHGASMVFDLEGTLTAGTQPCPFEELVRSLGRIEASHLILDLGHVRSLDSCGIGQLVALYNELRPRGIALTLVNLERHQKRLLEVAGLLGVFRVFDSRQQALASNGPTLSSRPTQPAEHAREATRDAA